MLDEGAVLATNPFFHWLFRIVLGKLWKKHRDLRKLDEKEDREERGMWKDRNELRMMVQNSRLDSQNPHLSNHVRVSPRFVLSTLERA